MALAASPRGFPVSRYGSTSAHPTADHLTAMAETLFFAGLLLTILPFVRESESMEQGTGAPQAGQPDALAALARARQAVHRWRWSVSASGLVLACSGVALSGLLSGLVKSDPFTEMQDCSLAFFQKQSAEPERSELNEAWSTCKFTAQKGHG